MQYTTETGIYIGTIKRKVDIARHNQINIVALSLYPHASTAELLTKLGFLSIHAITNTTTTSRATARSGKNTLIAFTANLIFIIKVGSHSTHSFANTGTNACLSRFLIASLGIESRAGLQLD